MCKVPLKSQCPPEMTLLKSQQNFQSCLKASFLFTPKFSQMTGVKTGKQHHKPFQIFYHYQTILTFSESYWHTILQTVPEFISSNTDIFRELLPNITDLFSAHIKQHSHFHIVITEQ